MEQEVEGRMPWACSAAGLPVEWLPFLTQGSSVRSGFVGHSTAVETEALRAYLTSTCCGLGVDCPPRVLVWEAWSPAWWD